MLAAPRRMLDRGRLRALLHLRWPIFSSVPFREANYLSSRSQLWLLLLLSLLRLLVRPPDPQRLRPPVSRLLEVRLQVQERECARGLEVLGHELFCGREPGPRESTVEDWILDGALDEDPQPSSRRRPRAVD